MRVVLDLSEDDINVILAALLVYMRGSRDNNAARLAANTYGKVANGMVVKNV